MADLSSDNLVGLYVAIAVYFSLLIAATVIAYRWKQQSSLSRSSSPDGGGNGDDDQQQQQINDHFETHFLGNRSLGPLVTTGTAFVSDLRLSTLENGNGGIVHAPLCLIQSF
mmetsp:Transcript_14255/g.26693  ORF Transcript_14255/g.26693 Transcript_14255/m.26693 type:complete len:112 (-) Transcript_14255:3431-3766(-)